jgi:hypothetical protein
MEDLYKISLAMAMLSPLTVVSNSISEYARLSSNYPRLQIRWIWNFRFFFSDFLEEKI